MTTFFAVAVLEPSAFLRLPLVDRLAQAGKTVRVTKKLHDDLCLAWEVASTDKPMEGRPFADSVTSYTKPTLMHTDLASSIQPGWTREQLQASLEERADINTPENAETQRARGVHNDHVEPAASPRKAPTTTVSEPRMSKRNAQGRQLKGLKAKKSKKGGKKARKAEFTATAKRSASAVAGNEPAHKKPPRTALDRTTLRRNKPKNAPSAGNAAVVAGDSGSTGTPHVEQLTANGPLSTGKSAPARATRTRGRRNTGKLTFG